ncbi:hypothetical protein CPC08DRAFT_103219 [Agrocybe pediades]|nr:hypothetical protein CPC08DRAFT_103219 [Agrocybe pediades]
MVLAQPHESRAHIRTSVVKPLSPSIKKSTMVCPDCEHAIRPIPLDSMTTCPSRTGCPACLDASKLENQVVRAMTRLKNLLRKLAAQRQTVNYAHSPIIHKMPVEVMSRIFTFVVHPRIAFRREELQHHTASVPASLGQSAKRGARLPGPPLRFGHT